MEALGQQVDDRMASRVQACRELYGIDRWGAGYFDISEQGNVVVRAPTPSGTVPIELMDVVAGLKGRGLEMPVMLRLENLITDRLKVLNESFQQAIDSSRYQNSYRGVFPIKVNQQRHVIEQIAVSGNQFDHGFEAGSKAELLIAMASHGSRNGMIICNGYKDREFVDLGMQATRIGFRCFFVIETIQELATILERADHWNVRPYLGVRLKLSTRVEGHWSDDSGDQSLFGLSPRRLIDVIDRLRAANKLGCLQMLHFHQGSQITNIRNIRDGIREACRFYAELIGEGAALQYLNIGGGLAVDYDGSASNRIHSRNYDLNEYCVDIVEAVMESLDPKGIRHPTLISESGRWTAAPVSVLLFDVLSVGSSLPETLPDAMPTGLSEPIENLKYTLDHITTKNLQECYNDAIYYRDQMRQLFRQGRISLRERALGENLHLTILNRVARLVPQMKRPPAVLVEMRRRLCDIYYGNFSVFQSLPDAWAIGQVFPVMPLHRLDQVPDRPAIIADLTCDCDGKLDTFVGPDENEPSLMLHPLEPGKDYVLGVFMVGAYQETLGDLHNLFGDTNVASVRVTSRGQLEFVQEIHGDSIADVLGYVEYQPELLYQQFRELAEAAVREGDITVQQRKEMLGLYADSLRGYTYFETE